MNVYSISRSLFYTELKVKVHVSFLHVDDVNLGIELKTQDTRFVNLMVIETQGVTFIYNLVLSHL